MKDKVLSPIEYTTEEIVFYKGKTRAIRKKKKFQNERKKAERIRYNDDRKNKGYIKKQTNRLVRRYRGYISFGNSYRKIYNYN